MKKINFILGTTLAGFFLISLQNGALDAGIGKLLTGKMSSAESAVFWHLRFPRSLLAILVGAALGLSGAAMQGLLRNPLAESSVLGISSGAVLGAMIALYSGLTVWGIWILPLGGFFGALAAAALVLVFCFRHTSLLGLILAGTALNTLFFALSSLLLSFSKNPYAVLEVIYWQMGSFENRTLAQTAVVAPWIILGSWMLLRTGSSLQLLTLGEDVARSSGVSVSKTMRQVIMGTAVAVGAAVSVCGLIGFVGLLVPHLVRPWVGHDPGKLLFPSALAGAVFLLMADTFCRFSVFPVELKIGVLTALLGAPFFIYLAFKTKAQLT
ncbi:MAG TPA: iron ABC transporter permease [Candidatus Omnitrophota bacterium]|nr:iron ABC transporter permease [Candidatus Omnitrophota bacterium]